MIRTDNIIDKFVRNVHEFSKFGCFLQVYLKYSKQYSKFEKIFHNTNEKKVM